MRASAEHTEFANALDNFETENPESTDFDQYTLEHNLAASRPAAQWTTPDTLPDALLDDLTDEIAADEKAISEALDSFYAEVDVPRKARDVRHASAAVAAWTTTSNPGAKTAADRGLTPGAPGRERQSLAGSMMAFAAVCGSIAGAIIIGMMVLSRPQPDSAAVALTSSAPPPPAPRAQVAGPEPAPGGAVPAQPAGSPAPSAGTADRPAVRPQPPVVPAPRGRETAGQADASVNPRAQTPPVPQSGKTVAPTSKPSVPVAPPRILIPGAQPGSSGPVAAPPVSPTVPPAATAGGLPPATREPAVLPAPPVPGPVASSPIPEATLVTPAPERAPAPPTGATPDAGANISVAAASPPTLPTPAPAAPAPTAPTTARPAASATAGNAIAAEESAVRTLLNQYRSAYNALNAGAAKAVWPSVDVKALGRAFDRLESQEFEFAGCQISVVGVRATAACNGSARFVPKVGNRNARREPRHWTFEMRRANQQWTIDKVNVQ